MKLKKILKAANYKISSGSEYLWLCFGENARFLELENRYGNASVVFDTVNQTVYSLEVVTLSGDFAYRWTNPDINSGFLLEAEERGVDPKNAWDDVEWIDLEVEADILEKMTAILAGENFDERVMIDINLTDEDLVVIAKAAHKEDKTLNQFINDSLCNYLDTLKE